VDHNTRAIVLKYRSFHIYLDQKSIGNFSLQSPFNRVFCINSIGRLVAFSLLHMLNSNIRSIV
jgi:hypothetical protein